MVSVIKADKSGQCFNKLTRDCNQAYAKRILFVTPIVAFSPFVFVYLFKYIFDSKIHKKSSKNHQTIVKGIML